MFYRCWWSITRKRIFRLQTRTRYRTRPLTLEMIRRLVSQLNLPAEVLIKPYALREEFLAA